MVERLSHGQPAQQAEEGEEEDAEEKEGHNLFTDGSYSSEIILL